ncbi:hypothetical protein [Pseudomonas paracarnis]|uniref:Tail fiber protein n=1 Tax=Pseudomonas paracarnis TaxID=2750625 RepID=A0ABU6BTY7_9PSED|nr:hypothetical protein [Pseudomonas paracarnis]MBW9244081.1 hypothetical protein [Pseudomonas paracarnis]MEB3783756.1 hypothetical protein [Pseudomonas paracarnis]
MTDQAQRLEIATVRAEIGSNITYRFNNDAIDAGGIPTESGDIKNLKLIIKEIEDKASISSSIYPTVAAGLAATAEGGMFLVASDEEGEIYTVWRKVGGSAVDTGKRALSSQAVEDAMEAAEASADSAQASALAAQESAADAVELRASLANGTDRLVDLHVVDYRGRDAYVALSFKGVSPMDFGAPGTGLTDQLTAIHQARDEAMARNIPLTIDAFFAANGTVVISDKNGFRMQGQGGIRCINASVPYAIDIRNCTDFRGGGVTIDGNSSTALVAIGRMAAIGAGKTCSLNRVDLNMINGPAAWQHGDFAWPDNLISENKFGGYTYNTPVCMINIGSQAVCNIIAADFVAAGQGVFAAYTHSMFINHGGAVIIGGSEAQMPTVSSGYAFVSCPVDSPAYDNRYGGFLIQNTAVETPSLLFLAYNPRSVPTPAAGTGGIQMQGNVGYHNCSVESFQGEANFSGKVLIGDNDLFRLVDKTTQNASFLGTPLVRISDTAFDEHFMKGLAGISGGIALFDFRPIFSANNLSSSPVNSGTSLLPFQSAASSGDNGHFFSSYNFSTGVFTVPAGGLKGVRVQIDFVNSAPNANSALQVRIGSTIVSSASGNAKYCSGVFELGDLPAGSQIVAQFVNAGTSFSATGGNQDRIVISARR